jgi:glucose/arabinose dehydrogenase
LETLRAVTLRLLLVLFLSPALFAATRPAAPLILEPSMDLQAVHGADVHMVTEKFSDADGDEHLCTDWEIREEQQVVWSAPCVAGTLMSHIHLGDGLFSGSHSGADALRAETRFELRVRFRDDGGDAETEWSEWSVRRFQTVEPTPVAPMLLGEILTARWDAEVPAGASLELQTVDGDALLRARSSGINLAPPRSSAAIVRLRVASGENALTIPPGELSFEDGHGTRHIVYLPAIDLEPDSEAFYWISANGGTHVAAALDRTPRFDDIARGAPVPWSFERGYRADVFATGFELPLAIAFPPRLGDSSDSPFVYVLELYGTVKVVTRGGEVRTFARDLINFDPRAPFPGNGERGLGGMTVDPNGDVIVTGIYQSKPGSAWPAPRVLRLQSDDGGLTAARVFPVIEFPNEEMAPSHQISQVTVGPDGKLYVQVGSSFSWIAQNMNTIDGKILRMNADGTAPSDNPFYDATDGITATDYIFALGMRNPWGGAWRIADGSLYEVENGPATDRLAKVVAGRNYLWDGFDPSMRNYAIHNWIWPVAPLQIAFTEPERFGASGFPEEKHRSAFITESGATWAAGPLEHGKRISEVVIGPDETLIGGPAEFAVYTGSGRATAAGLAAGPDGLYFTDLYRDFGETSPFDAGANLFRIRYVGFADFRVRFINSNTVALTDRSEVPDAESMLWEFGDGSTSTDRFPVHRYAQGGKYLVRQTVTGPRGAVTHAHRVFVGGGDAGEVRVEYFESEQALTPAATEVEAALDFDWSSATSAPPHVGDGFFARFTVPITPRFSETYRFTVQSRDRVRVKLDGKMLIDAWQPGDSGEASATVSLLAGHAAELTVEYVDQTDAPSLKLFWESDSQPSHVVPRSASSPRRRAVGK